MQIRPAHIASVLLLIAPALPATAADRPAPPPPAVFPYGAAWYPEWYGPAEWDAELAQLARAGITYVRIAEFAWARIEPREGEYDFTWLDAAIARASSHGMKVLIGTPTAAPPIWLTRKYPDVLVVEEDGRPARHGRRRHGSVASARYRQMSATIATKLAERYGRNPAVIGFQIDNEFGRMTYDPANRAAFHDWLKREYGSVDAMNDAWFTTYWSQTYNDFAEVDIPRPTGDNPAHWLAWQRFWSDQLRAFQKVQIDAIRPHLSDDKIVTTNLVSHYEDFDFSVPAQDLDVVGWDWYHEQPRLDPAEGAMLHDLYRGFLGRNPWILEATPSNIVFVDKNVLERKGAIRAMVWQAVAHGADSWSWWTSRTPLNGQETLHGTLLDAAGRPRHMFGEVAQIGAELKKVWPKLRGTIPVADVAMLHDYPSRWSLKRDPLVKQYNAWDGYVAWHRAFAPLGRGIDVLRGTPDLGRYKLVIAPNLHLVDQATVDRLTAYVQGGGHLVLGPRAGLRQRSNALWRTGAFDALLGARSDHYQTPEQPVTLSGPVGSGQTGLWAERIADAAPGLDVLMRYGAADGWLDGAPGVVSRAVGKGRVTYVGAWLDPAGLAAVAQWSASQAKLSPLWGQVEAGVEVAARQGASGTVHVAINWSDSARTITPPAGMADAMTGRRVTQAITLAPGDVTVLVK